MKHEETHLNNDKVTLLLDFEVEKLIPLINWSFFFNQWSVAGRFPEIFDHPTKGVQAKKLYDDACQMLGKMEVTVNGAAKTFTARQVGDDVAIKTCDCCQTEVRMPFLRNQTSHFMALSDFVTPTCNQITPFALCVHNRTSYDDEYKKIMSEILCNRLADAMQTYIQQVVEEKLGVKSLTFAFGYPACPDHSPKKLVFDLLGAQKMLGMEITTNYAMLPLSSCCGVIISHPDVNYFNIGYVDQNQLENYAKRANITVDELKTLIPNNLLPL